MLHKKGRKLDPDKLLSRATTLVKILKIIWDIFNNHH